MEAIKSYIQSQSSLFLLALVETGCNNAKNNPLSAVFGEQVIEIAKSCMLYQIELLEKCSVSLDDNAKQEIASNLGKTETAIYLANTKNCESNIKDAMATAERLQSSSYLRERQADEFRNLCASLRIVLGIGMGALTIYEGTDEGTALVYLMLINATDSLIKYDTCSFAQKEKFYQNACEWLSKARVILPPEFQLPTAKKPVEPIAQAPNNNSSGGCYVATAVYGSYDCPQVWTLRRYRDFELAKSFWGRAFIKTYYAISPTLVKWFGETNWFKHMWRGKLDRMVSNLQARGFSSAPYKDHSW